MIVNLHQGNLPVFVCNGCNPPADRNVTLTEVACHAIYGALLTPGRGTLREHLCSLRDECHVLWSHGDGPLWLRPHLELMAVKQRWKFAPNCSKADRQVTLAWFAKAQKWLRVMRLQSPPIDASKDVCEAKRRLSDCTEAEAIQIALEASSRLEADEAAINGKSTRFYSALSSEVIAGRVVLKGIPVAAKDGGVIPRNLGAPPHTAIPLDYFNLPLVHDLYDNEIEFNCFGSDLEIVQSLFNRERQRFVDSLVRYVDVRVPPEGVNLLLTALNGSAEPSEIFKQNGAKRPGRKPGTGAYQHSDRELAKEMEDGRLKGDYKNLHQAAVNLSDRADGSSFGDAKKKRLSNAYRKRYPNSPWSK